MLGLSIAIPISKKATGGVTGDPSAPRAPILAWTSGAFDTTPEFNIDFDETVVVTDVVTVQYDDNLQFSSPAETTNALDASEILAQQINMAIGALGAGTYYVRAKIAHGVHVSNWSNVETIIISVPTASYSYRGSGTSTIGGSVVTYSIDIGAAAADRLVIVGSLVDNATTITSVVVNGVTLTLDVTGVGSYRVGFHSGIVAAGSGSQNVVVTWASASFQEKNIFVWTSIGLSSNLKKQTAAWTGATASIAVDAGDFMFAVGRNVVGFPDYATSTESPDATRQVGLHNTSADWIVNATNAAFTLNAAAGNNFSVAVTYR
jgi:hypothetical protein